MTSSGKCWISRQNEQTTSLERMRKTCHLKIALMIEVKKVNLRLSKDKSCQTSTS